MPKMAQNKSALHDVLAQDASNKDIKVYSEMIFRFSHHEPMAPSD